MSLSSKVCKFFDFFVVVDKSTTIFTSFNQTEDVVYNTSKMKAYAASFDAKGNLHLKFKLVNNSYGKITNVSKFKVSVKDSSNKSFVSYSKNNFKTNVASYRDKDCTIIIPKSALKKSYKKIDLRTAKISISGNFASASL